MDKFETRDSDWLLTGDAQIHRKLMDFRQLVNQIAHSVNTALVSLSPLSGYQPLPAPLSTPPDSVYRNKSPSSVQNTVMGFKSGD